MDKAQQEHEHLTVQSTGGDNIAATIGNVSGGQVAVGKNIQQTHTVGAPAEPFKVDEFLNALREFKKIVADLEIDDDVKEELEDNISNMRQEVKQAKEAQKEPDKKKLKTCLENSNAVIETLGKAAGLGATLWPAMHMLGKFVGLPW